MSKCICAKCEKTPSEISEYVTAAAMDGYATAEDYVRENEGTLILYIISFCVQVVMLILAVLL